MTSLLLIEDYLFKENDAAALIPHPSPKIEADADNEPAIWSAEVMDVSLIEPS